MFNDRLEFLTSNRKMKDKPADLDAPFQLSILGQFPSISSSWQITSEHHLTLSILTLGDGVGDDDTYLPFSFVVGDVSRLSANIFLRWTLIDRGRATPCV